MFKLFGKKEPCYVCLKKAKLDIYGICKDCNNNSDIDFSNMHPAARLHISGEFFAVFGQQLNKVDIPMIEAYRLYCIKHTPEDERENYYNKALQALEEYKHFFLSKGIAGRIAWYERINRLDPNSPQFSLNGTLYNLLKATSRQ